MSDPRGCVCVFVKAPRPGGVKTRLAPAVGSDGAAALARAFFLDTLAAVRALPWARPIVAADGDLCHTAGVAPGVEVWPQGGGDLGERIERILARALERAPFAIALGADTPGLPRGILESAREGLGRSEAVIGPSEDGGFYLLGLRRCPRGLLGGMPWSRDDTCARTCLRLETCGLDPVLLERWFDVDRPEDLARLRRLLEGGQIRAPETLRALRAVLRASGGST